MKTLLSITMVATLTSRARAEPSPEQLYVEGQRAFERRDYAKAIDRWQASYELSKAPLLVLNMAQAHRLAGDCERALSAYRRYVSLDPASSEERSLAETFIADLTPKCGTPEERAPGPGEGAGSARKLKLSGIVTASAGGAVVVTGLLFGLRASSLGDEVTRDCAVSCDWADVKSKEADGKRAATIGKVLDVVGVAAIAVGAGLYIYGVREGRRSIAIQPSADGVALSWSGSW